MWAGVDLRGRAGAGVGRGRFGVSGPALAVTGRQLMNLKFRWKV